MTLRTRASDVIALTSRGLDGAPKGMTGADAAEGADSPWALRAMTVKVYGEPLVRPVTVQVVAPVVVHDFPGVDEVTTYPLMADPPCSTGACHETTTCPLPGVAVTPKGAEGTPPGVTGADGVEGTELPAAFLATTENVYAVPLVRPVTTQVRAVVVEQDMPPGDAVAV